MCSKALANVIMAFVLFFFQAEDGIRDYKVTGVQTCALPICRAVTAGMKRTSARNRPSNRSTDAAVVVAAVGLAARSGEGRVGKEGRSRGAPGHLKKKKKNI